MILVKPSIQHKSFCPYCSSLLKPVHILWMGMHILVKAKCSKCSAIIVEDLKSGHALIEGNKIDLEKEIVFENKLGEKSLLKYLKDSDSQEVEIKKEVFKYSKQVIILNCIDYLYGHCLLKLLNAQRHLKDFPQYGLVVIVPQFLRWMVPDGIAEIWTVNIALKNGLLCYSNLNEFVHQEFDRFEQAYVSEAYSHPSQFDITKFTTISNHDFRQEQVQVTFIWRQDRLWCNSLLFRILKKLNLLNLGLMIQNWKIQKLFTQIQKQVPSAKFTVTGFGNKTHFPEWIDDYRCEKFDVETERKMCQTYADSRLVIGVHGSNMLLPSAHAGMTIDLMPNDRWGNFAQDILYQETDSRLAAFRYRYMLLHISTSTLADVSSSMLLNYPQFVTNMTQDNK